MQNISIPVPSDLIEDPECDFDLKEYFQDLVEEDFEPVLDTDVWEQDERAVACGVEIDNVEVRDDTIIVYYSVSFSAYHGCRDRNWSGQDERHIAGTRAGDSWVFPAYVRRLPRDTFEEF